MEGIYDSVVTITRNFVLKRVAIATDTNWPLMFWRGIWVFHQCLSQKGRKNKFYQAIYLLNVILRSLIQCDFTLPTQHYLAFHITLSMVRKWGRRHTLLNNYYQARLIAYNCLYNITLHQNLPSHQGFTSFDELQPGWFSPAPWIFPYLYVSLQSPSTKSYSRFWKWYLDPFWSNIISNDFLKQNLKYNIMITREKG